MTASAPEAPVVTVVAILCPLYNGASFLPAFIQSIQTQSFQRWMLILRDDGSTDDSSALACAATQADPRICIAADSGRHLGVVGAFKALLNAVPADIPYVMFADQDDVWLPTKVEQSLDAMHAAEHDFTGPVLVHTDLEVVDETLALVDRSFWRYAGIDVRRSALRDLTRKNIVTGATVLFNAPLCSQLRRMPDDVPMHDWWAALVASALGRVVAVPVATVKYRQHGANAIGASASLARRGLARLIADAVTAFDRSPRVRHDIQRGAQQAHLLLREFGHRLAPDDRTFLTRYAQLAEARWWHRKVGVARLHLSVEQGWLKRLGILLRV